jgi:hypothetical protein
MKRKQLTCQACNAKIKTASVWTIMKDGMLIKKSMCDKCFQKTVLQAKEAAAKLVPHIKLGL